MKKSMICFLCLVLSAMVIGQNPSFSIDDYLKKNLVCPSMTAQCCMEGTEIVQFTVTPAGEVTDFRVINSVCSLLDEEVIRVLRTTGGMWETGSQDGQPSGLQSEVVFMLSDYSSREVDKHFTKTAERYFKAGCERLFIKNNPERALACFNEGIRYMPKDKSLLQMRGLCLYELGEPESARRDWNRIAVLGGLHPEEIDHQLVSMKGYPEMIEILSFQ